MGEVESRLRAICGGDTAAQEWLYDRFAPGLFRRLRGRYLRMDLDIEDLLHDSFVFFFARDGKVLATFLERNPGSETTEERLARYLWDLSCGVAANHRRARNYRRTLSLDEQLPAPSSDPDPEQLSLDRDAIDQLARCLRTASRRVYLYFKLRYVDGLKPDEVAAATGWSKKATYKLKGSLNEAVARCAQKLGLRLSH